MAKKNFYAVKNGRIPGIYKTWEETKEQTSGYPNADYKGFVTLEEAKKYMTGEEGEKASESGLSAYVDGSFDKKTMNYSFGTVILKDGELIETISGRGENAHAAEMRNVAGELRAAMEAMNYAVKNNYDSITIYHDYQGIAKWADGSWKANLEATKMYKAYCGKLKGRLEVKFVKVAAHTGVKYNEMADKLAKDAFRE